MKNRVLLIVFLLTWGISLPGLIAQKVQFDSLETFIDTMMMDFDVPGLSIGIVQNDSIIYCKGFGLRDVGKDLSVDENTIFGIGSISKSFTALTLGILVDEGKINWDDKVRDYIPYFELYEPYVSENFTVRDLLTHRSGLKFVSGGMLLYHTDFSRADIIKRLKYLKPVSGFREIAAYQNVMYLVVAEIVQEVSGMSWDDFLQIKVFDKTGMENSTSVSTQRDKITNIAQPHIWDEHFKKQAIEHESCNNIASVGFIYSSAKEMSNYMRLLLNNGVYENDTIVSSKVVNEIFKPQIHYQSLPAPIHNEFTSYGFGWWLTPKNGHKIIDHSGGIDGMSANLIMIKDLNFGVIVMTNTDELAAYLLTFKVLEQVLNDGSYDIYVKVKSWRDDRLERKKRSALELEATRINGTKPSLSLKSYTGIYTDQMYGDITISKLDDEVLEISFSHSPVFRGILKHWHYDTFQVDWYDTRIPDGFITFNFNSKREILGITIDQKNLLDVDFSELEILKKKTE